ncbi:MAG: hypothetical protein ACO31D_05595 [Ilumatobacteraceae bacterium]
MRNSRILASLCAFAGFLLIVVVRGWSGLDQIPSDPGYDYIGERVRTGFKILEVQPYLYADQSLIASTASLLPLEARGIFLTVASHVIWACCALAVFHALRRLGVGTVTSFVGGLLLVTTPWAAQSAIGNYGNIRWPILVAAVITISGEITSEKPRALPIALGAVAATLSNPLHPLLLAPLLVGTLLLKSEQRKYLSFGAAPLVVGLVVNVLNVGAGGHDEKITSFWAGVGLFWVSGQVLPTAIALTGLVLSSRNLRAASRQRFFAVQLFALVVLIAGASFQLGGIADRYYVAPAALAAVGALIWLTDFRTRAANLGKVVALVLAAALAVPTVRWFFVFPYLRSAEGWSTQVERVREQCSTGEISSFELVTSSGQSRTDPISCDDL